MRDRLIKLICGGMAENCGGDCVEPIGSYCPKCHNIAGELFEDGWIRLPCKVGDVVWLIGNMELYTKEKLCSRTVTSVQILRTGELLIHFKDGCFPPAAVGVYVFFTREEAEKALKGGAE